jgi:hypothetical protein
MKVCFTLDNPKRETSTIRGNIHAGGKRFTYPTGASAKTALFKNQRCKNHKSFPEAAAVEAAMKNAMIYFKRDFKTPETGEFRRKVDQFLSGSNAMEIRREDESLLSFIERYINEHANDKGVKGYRTTMNKLRAYQEEKEIKIGFAD